MPLIKCPECGKEISDKATVCPNCGYPIADNIEHIDTKAEQPSKADIMFLINEQPVNMTQLWNAKRDKEECIKQLSQQYNVDSRMAEKMVTDYIVQAGIKPIEKKVKEKKKNVFGSIVLLILAFVMIVAGTIPGAIFFAVLSVLLFWDSNYSGSIEKIPNKPIKKNICPRCGSKRFHAFIEEQVISPEKVKSSTSLNLNPLKPFTVYNHKTKVVRQASTRQISKFVCDDCGKIFD